MLYIMFCTLFFFSFLLNNTSWHSFLIHLIHSISIWFSNIWMCHNLISTLLMAKHLLKTSLGPLAVDTLFIKREEGPLFHSFTQTPIAPKMIQLGPEHLANTTTKQSISGTGVQELYEKSCL